MDVSSGHAGEHSQKGVEIQAVVVSRYVKVRSIVTVIVLCLLCLAVVRLVCAVVL